jgi:hypothetical protein
MRDVAPPFLDLVMREDVARLRQGYIMQDVVHPDLVTWDTVQARWAYAQSDPGRASRLAMLEQVRLFRA